MTLPIKKDSPPIPLPAGTIITASGYTADGKSSIQREIDAGRYEGIEDWKYKLSRFNPMDIENLLNY